MLIWETYEHFRRASLQNGWKVEEPLKGTWREMHPHLDNLVCSRCRKEIEYTLYFYKEEYSRSWRCHDCAVADGIVW